jgi:hypothetical protein
MKHGYGRLLWADGKIYDGTFIEGSYEGYGKMSWVDG